MPTESAIAYPSNEAAQGGEAGAEDEESIWGESRRRLGSSCPREDLGDHDETFL